jgi:hypothetical protein
MAGLYHHLGWVGFMTDGLSLWATRRKGTARRQVRQVGGLSTDLDQLLAFQLNAR